MLEEITLEEVELRPGKFCDIFLTVNLELVDCECTSPCGDGMVTERWQEVEIQDLQVNKLIYWTMKLFNISSKAATSASFISWVSRRMTKAASCGTAVKTTNVAPASPQFVHTSY